MQSFAKHPRESSDPFPSQARYVPISSFLKKWEKKLQFFFRFCLYLKITDDYAANLAWADNILDHEEYYNQLNPAIVEAANAIIREENRRIVQRHWNTINWDEE